MPSVISVSLLDPTSWSQKQTFVPLWHSDSEVANLLASLCVRALWWNNSQLTFECSFYYMVAQTSGKLATISQESFKYFLFMKWWKSLKTTGLYCKYWIWWGKNLGNIVQYLTKLQASMYGSFDARWTISPFFAPSFIIHTFRIFKLND